MASIALNGAAGQWVRIGQAAELLGVSDQTVRNWCRDGILTYRLTIGGQRQIDRRSVERALGMDTGADEPASGATVVYARVSTSQQRTDGNLDRQVDRLNGAVRIRSAVPRPQPPGSAHRRRAASLGRRAVGSPQQSVEDLALRSGV